MCALISSLEMGLNSDEKKTGWIYKGKCIHENKIFLMLLRCYFFSFPSFRSFRLSRGMRNKSPVISISNSNALVGGWPVVKVRTRSVPLNHLSAITLLHKFMWSFRGRDLSPSSASAYDAATGHQHLNVPLYPQ